MADLHGSETVFRKLSNSAGFYNVSKVVVAGDLTGKLLIPVVESQGALSFKYYDETKTVDRRNFEGYAKQIRSMGHYYRIVSKEEYAELLSEPSNVRKAFLDAMIESLHDFFSLIRERFGSRGAQLYLISGNDDYPEVERFIKENDDQVIVDYEQKAVEFWDKTIIGLGYSNPTPWKTPRELTEDEIFSRLKQILSGLDARKTVLVVHVPPFNTLIDKAPKLKDFKPIVSGGQLEMVSVGSTAVRKTIEEFEPVVSLHGHIHESGGFDAVRGLSGANVHVYNPGSEYSSGILRGVLLELRSDGSATHHFVRG
ncbi:MAG: hypothetical protein QW767_00770 [Thermoprotei archaeon]